MKKKTCKARHKNSSTKMHVNQNKKHDKFITNN